MRIYREVKTHGPGPRRLDLRRSERRSERPLNQSCCRCAPTDTHGGFRAAILYPEPEESSSPSRGAAPLEYRFSGIDGGESDVLNRPEADRVLRLRRRHAVVRNLANACSFPAVGVRVQRKASAHGRKRKQKEVRVMEPNMAG